MNILNIFRLDLRRSPSPQTPRQASKSVDTRAAHYALKKRQEWVKADLQRSVG